MVVPIFLRMKAIIEAQKISNRYKYRRDRSVKYYESGSIFLQVAKDSRSTVKRH